MGVGRADHQGAEPAQLFLQQACSTVTAQGTEAVAAHQFSKITAVVSWRTTDRPHLHQGDRYVGGGDLPRCFGAGKPSAQDSDGSIVGQRSGLGSPQPTNFQGPESGAAAF